MSDNSYQSYRTTLAAAGSNGDTRDVNVVGDFMRVLSATAGTISDLEISVNQGRPSVAFVGFALNLQNAVEDIGGRSSFYTMTIRNLSAAPNTVVIGAGDAAIIDDRLNLSGSITANVVVPNTVTTAADVTVNTGASGQVLAAKAGRQNAYVFNPGAIGTTPIRVGDTNVTASRGMAVPPQQGITLFTTAAIFVRNDTGGNLAFPVMETETV